jgi:hypothetical protein
MFSKLPTELILQIRNYLIIIAIEPCFDKLRRYVLQESQWSWRNFLSTANNEYWKGIRKNTMIWSLNRIFSMKYLTNEVFRDFIVAHMDNPAQQLQGRFAEGDSTKVCLLNDLLVTSEIGLLDIRNYAFNGLPSLEGLQTLIIENCNLLTELGSYPHLKRLRLTRCPILDSIGAMPELSELSLTDVPKHLINFFPLEKIQKLSLIGTFKNFPDFASRLQQIKELNFCLNMEGEISSKNMILPFPSLEVLKLNYSYPDLTFDVTNLSRLTHFELGSMRLSNILGIKKFYPQLKTFSYAMDVSTPISESYQESQFPNLSDLTLIFASKSIEPFHIHDKIRSLKILLRVNPITGVLPGRHFHHVFISSMEISDISMFSKVQRFHLSECVSVVDITALKDIPYLFLENLPALEDFSCLGNQKYLKIDCCDYLSNDHVNNHFGNISCLSLEFCQGLTHIKNLTKNRFVQIGFCDCLKEVELSGMEYVTVKLQCCSDLSNVVITGKIHSLVIFGRNMLEKLTGDYEYFNGEPKTDLIKTFE